MSAGTDFFLSGPFASASINQQLFGDRLYFSHIFQDSLRERQRIEDAHAQALADDNIDLAQRKKTELDYLDGIVKLTLEIQLPGDGIES